MQVGLIKLTKLLFVGLYLGIIVIASIISYSIYQQYSILNLLQKMYDHPFVVSNTSLDISYNMHKVYDIVISKDLNDESIKQQLYFLDQKIIEDLSKVKSLYLGNKNEIDNIQANYLRLRQLSTITPLPLKDIEYTHQLISDDISGVIYFARNKANEFHNTAEYLVNEDLYHQSIIFFLIFSVGSTIAMILMKNIKNRFDEVLWGMSSFCKMDINHKEFLEFFIVKSTFNKMIDDVNEYQYKIQSQNEELMQQAEALEEYNEELSNSNAMLVHKAHELEENEAKLSLSQHIAHIGSFAYHIDTKYFEASKEAVDMYGLDPNKLITYQDFVNILLEDDRNRVLQSFDDAINKGTKYDVIYKIILSNNTHKWIYAQGEAIYEQNKAIKIVGTVQDITKIQILHEEITRQKELFETITNAVQDGIFVVDKNSKMIYANKAMSDIAGVSQESLVGVNLMNDYSEATAGEFLIYYKKAISTLQPTYFEANILTPANRQSWQKGWIVPKVSKNNTFDGAICTTGDYTKEKIAQQKIDEMTQEVVQSEERLYYALEGVGDGFWDWYIPTNDIYFSKSWKEMIGYNDNELANTMQEWSSRIHPQDIHQAYKKMNEYILANSGVFANEIRMLCKDGSYKWILCRGVIVQRDENNNPIRIIGSHTDISELKKLTTLLQDINENLELQVKDEIQKRLDQERILIQQSKMAMMGEMIGNIAHQWRQPLNQMSILKEVLVDQYYEDDLSKDSIEKYSHQIDDVLGYMSRTIDDFRNYFLPNKDKEKFSICESLQSAMNIILASLANHNITVIRNCEEGNIIEGYKNELSQVFINIINNAKDALIQNHIKNKHIWIDMKGVDNTVIIQIKDNAGGVPNDIIDRIFEPYFTTKFASKGTGLGLYMSKNMIEKNMDGDIIVSNDDQGAIFTIKLKKL